MKEINFNEMRDLLINKEILRKHRYNKYLIFNDTSTLSYYYFESLSTSIFSTDYELKQNILITDVIYEVNTEYNSDWEEDYITYTIKFMHNEEVIFEISDSIPDSLNDEEKKECFFALKTLKKKQSFVFYPFKKEINS